MRTKYTTYKPYEKAIPVPCQYQPVGTAVPVMQHQFRYWEAKRRINGEQGNEVRKDSKRLSRIKTISHRTHRIHGTIQ